MSKAKFGLVRKKVKNKNKNKNHTLDSNSKGNIGHKPGLHPQPELPGILYPLLRSPRSFSLLFAFTALVERGETLGRVSTGKQKHRDKVPVGPTRQRSSDKANTLSRPAAIPG